MYKIFLLSMIGLTMGGCSSLEDSEVAMKINSEKRKPKHEYMHPEEEPLEDHFETEKILPIAPQVGIRIPLGK